MARSDGDAGQVMSGAGVVRSDAGVEARSDTGARRVMSGAGVAVRSSASARRVLAGLVWGWRGVVLVLGGSCPGLKRWRGITGSGLV